MNYLHDREMAERGAGERAMAIAASGAALINGDAFEEIQHLIDFKSDAYITISHQLQSLCTYNRLRNDAAKTLRRKGNVTNFVVSSANRNMINQEFNLWAEMNTTFNSGEISIKPGYQRDDHLFVSGFAPIKNKSSEVVGILQIDLVIDDIFPPLTDYLKLPILALVFILILIVLVYKLIFDPLQDSIDSLAVHFATLAEGELSIKYTEPENGYLHEISTLLDKLQAGFNKKLMSDEDKEKLQRQIKELLRIVSAAANGDFTVNAKVTADTLGALADSFNLMVSDLSELVRDVKKGAEHVADSTKEMLEKTTEMASGAESQAKEIENIGNLAKGMAEVAENTDKSAQRASEAAIHAKDVAERGGAIVEQSIEGMQRIRETVTDTSDRVKILGDSSTRISEITEFISDISNRTNILALNATIEAARAGNSGRGFTNIADEIRNLAERSSRSAGEITKLIEDIQTGMSETVMAMSLGNNEVAEGTKKVDAAGSALREIQGAVEISTSSVAEITKATEKQLKASEDIVNVMEGIASIAKRTADGAKQTENEITRLESLSKSLNNAVSKFKLSH
jgi:twitching motility protein PilJ